MESFSEKIIDLLISFVIALLCIVVGVLTGKLGEFALIGLVVIIAVIEIRKATVHMKKTIIDTYEDDVVDDREESLAEEIYAEGAVEEVEEIEEEVDEEILPDFSESLEVENVTEFEEASTESEEIMAERPAARAKLVREEENVDDFHFGENLKIYIESVEQLDGINHQDFEIFCAKLLKKNGYTVVKERSNGIDLIVTNAIRKYAVMCKQSTTPLSEEDILRLEEGKMHYDGYIGVVMTNGRIASDAIRLANSKGLLLWDRAVIYGMMDKIKSPIDI